MISELQSVLLQLVFEAVNPRQSFYSSVKSPCQCSIETSITIELSSSTALPDKGAETVDGDGGSGQRYHDVP